MLLRIFGCIVALSTATTAAVESTAEPTAAVTEATLTVFNSTVFVEELLTLLRKEIDVNATINSILNPFEITATDDDVADTNFSASVFRGYFTGFNTVARKDRCSHKNSAENVTVQCLITFRSLKAFAYCSVKGEARSLVTVSTAVEDVIFLIEFEGPHHEAARLHQFKAVLDPLVKSQIVEGTVRSKWFSEFRSHVGQNIGIQLMKILYRDFRATLDTILSHITMP